MQVIAREGNKTGSNDNSRGDWNGMVSKKSRMLVDFYDFTVCKL